jgi:hypothetical protein
VSEANPVSLDHVAKRDILGRRDTVETRGTSGIKVSRDGKALLVPPATSVECVCVCARVCTWALAVSVRKIVLGRRTPANNRRRRNHAP